MMNMSFSTSQFLGMLCHGVMMNMSFGDGVMLENPARMICTASLLNDFLLRAISSLLQFTSK